MKKVLSALLVMALIAALISGCASTDPAETPSPVVEAPEASAAPEPAPEESEAPAETPAAEEVPEEPEPETPAIEYPLSDETITFSLFFSLSPNLAPYVESMNDIYCYRAAEEKTNVHLDATLSTPETTSEKFNVMIASGEYTDLIHNMNYSSGAEAAIDDEVTIDVLDYLEQYAPDYWRFLEENPNVLKQYKTEGGYMPSIRGLSYMFLQGPVIRQDWLDDIGMEIPTTIDELEQALEGFKVEKGAKNAVLFTSGNNFMSDAYNVGDGSDGIRFSVRDGKVQACYFMDGFREFTQKMADWNKAGYFDSDFISLFGSNAARSFVLSDDTGFWVASQDNLGQVMKNQYSGPAESFLSVPMAMVTEAEGGTVKTGEIYDVSGESWFITTACTEPETAVSYLNWFFTEEGTLICNYGEEGVSFEYDETGKPRFTETVTANPDGLSQMLAGWLYTCFQAPYIQDMSRTDSLYTDQYQIDAAGIWNSNRSNEERFYGSLTSEESTEYATLATDLNSYASGMILKFWLNEEPMSNFDSFLSRLKELNVDRLIEIQQAAYDRYLAK